jgi:hypothetical protein
MTASLVLRTRTLSRCLLASAAPDPCDLIHGVAVYLHAGVFNGQTVAVKLFRGDVGPDGRVDEEVGISCSLRHPNLTRVRALVTEPRGLVLDLVKGVPLALKPTSQHLLRCK